MTIQEIFEKAKNEDGLVSADSFNEAIKANKAKFTDLSEGKYVDKQKYLDDLATKDTEISTLNETLSTRDTDLEALKSQLEEAGGDSSKLEELTAKFSELQSKYETDTKALQGKLNEQAYEFAVRDFAGKQKFTSKAARKEFERQMIAKSLPMENGNIMGANDWLKEYSKENGDSFVKEQKNQPSADKKPKFSASADGQGNSNSKMTLTELMQLKNENPNAAISFD